MIKYPLLPPKQRNKRDIYFYWKSCPPFVENNRATLIHRPKRVQTISDPSRKFRSIAVEMWCGNHQNGNDKFTFLSEPPEGKLVCFRCEMMAIEAGLLSSEQIVGRHVHLGHVKPIITCHPELNKEGEQP